MLSPEIQVMLSPAAAYGEYASGGRSSGLWIGVRRPLFVALVQGVAIAMAATETVAAPIVVSMIVCWSVAVIVQVLAAALFIRVAPARTTSFSGALDLFFLGHAPWSLWILASAAAFAWLVPYFTWIVLLTMAVPAALTARILVAFAQTVLGMDRRAALRLTALHQAFIWIVLLGYLGAAVALWPRAIGMIR